MQDAHYNMKPSLIILCNQIIIPQKPMSNLKPIVLIFLDVHCITSGFHL